MLILLLKRVRLKKEHFVFSCCRWRWSALCWRESRSLRWPNCKGRRNSWTNSRERFTAQRGRATLRSHRYTKMVGNCKAFISLFKRQDVQCGFKPWGASGRDSEISSTWPPSVQSHFLSSQTHYLSRRKCLQHSTTGFMTTGTLNAAWKTLPVTKTACPNVQQQTETQQSQQSVVFLHGEYASGSAHFLCGSIPQIKRWPWHVNKYILHK